MSKAFTRESDTDDSPEQETPALPAGLKNYITPAGFQRLKEEALQLLDQERPELVKVIQWAASNGDRSENADYIYGKRRLREIDRRIRFLTKRLDAAVVVDPAARESTDQVFFGATVTVANRAGTESTYSIVGIDEADVSRGRISWISPLAKALIKAREGDSVILRTPGGDEALDIVAVEYRAIE
ncbi:MAG: transcription elongation factor GreB [Gammaproteobacteria bacterium]|nr:transcription elongation factor GreB [Gammaproteobacteria bacterium]